MTPDPILILAATTILLSLAGLCLFARVRAAEGRLDTHEAEIRQLWQERRRLIDALGDVGADLTQTARDAAKTADDLTDLRGEYLAQARTLDAHDERLQALETPKETV